MPDALLVFVVPPSLDTLVEHLKARRTESAEQLEMRQRNAALELARKDDYDYVVVNEEGRRRPDGEAHRRDHLARGTAWISGPGDRLRREMGAFGGVILRDRT